MAYGQSKSEFQGDAALLAVKASAPSPALPAFGTKVTLSYPGKLVEEDILKPVVTSYRLADLLGQKPIPSPLANGLVWADNWYALHALLSSGQKAKLIYLDPPYATGLDFQSRTLEHAYADTLEDAAYIEFMRRRLVLLREILSDDGSLYVHIGHQMLGSIKLILDEVFGSKNCRNIITRRKCSSKNSTRNQYPNLNDYVLFYSKSKNYIWNRPTQKAGADWIAKEYTKRDERGQYKLVPVHAPGVRHGETGETWKGMNPPPGKHWQLTPSKLDALDTNGEIHWSKNGNPRRKVYLPENKGIPVTDYWDGFRDAHHQSILITGYPTEKNLDMMKMIVETSSNPGDLVVDPFNGSGSTIHAADMLGRKWIGIDESLVAIKTTINRLSLGRAPMGDFVEKEDVIGLFDEHALIAPVHEATGSIFQLYVEDEVASTHPNEFMDLAQMKL